ncbi:MAG: hypothetical protein J5819_06420 [Eubacterium sp.]|nr:hypothetical protein [Eubacterium sp.]
MKRYLLVAVVLFAAIFAIYFIVTRSEKETQENTDQTTEERDVLGLTAVSGSSAEPVSATSTPQGESEALASISENEASDSVTGAAAETELEVKAKDFSEDIVQGLTSRVLDEANDELQSQTTIKDINLSFESVTSSLGEYIGVERVISSTENGYRAVTATLRYEGNDGATIRYIFDENDKLAGIWFDNTTLASSVEKGSRYEEKKIKIGRTPFVLDGVLTLPMGDSVGDDKPPVVLLISDLDDADMDGSIGESENKPLRDVAHGLALRGIASIRYNRRLNQYPDTTGSNAGIREFLIKDAWMAIDSVYHESSVDTNALFVLAWGRSAEYLEPILDKRIQRIAGAIMIGAKPTKHSEMSYIDEDVKVESDAKYFMTKHDTFPLMLLQGERDYETPLSQFERWQTLFTGRSHTDYHQYRELGHYLWPGSAEPSAADYDAPNSVSNQAIGDIANWCAEVAVRD